MRKRGGDVDRLQRIAQVVAEDTEEQLPRLFALLALGIPEYSSSQVRDHAATAATGAADLAGWV
jgi:hypothetical protein